MNQRISSPNYSVEPMNYKLYRPTYGNEIYEFISKIVDSKGLCWDVACGSGQATLPLSKIFNRVWATDIDQIQLDHCEKIDNVDLICGGEKISEIKNESIDCITVATGIHWLNRELFYEEAQRVLKKGGILAIWGYSGIHLNKEIDNTIEEIIEEFFMPHYPEAIKIAFNNYKEIELPFQKLEVPVFKIKNQWNLFDLLNYFSSFTAMQNYKSKTGKDGTLLFKDRLIDAWGSPPENTKVMEWDLNVKFSKK